MFARREIKNELNYLEKMRKLSRRASIFGSRTILIPVIMQNVVPRIGVRGKKGVANFKSLAVWPDLIHWRRKLY